MQTLSIKWVLDRFGLRIYQHNLNRKLLARANVTYTIANNHSNDVNYRQCVCEFSLMWSHCVKVSTLLFKFQIFVKFGICILFICVHFLKFYMCVYHACKVNFRSEIQEKKTSWIYSVEDICMIETNGIKEQQNVRRKHSSFGGVWFMHECVCVFFRLDYLIDLFSFWQSHHFNAY